MAKVWNEVEITRRRVNKKIASDATVDHAAQAAIHGGKKGQTAFEKLVKGLTDGGS